MGNENIIIGYFNQSRITNYYGSLSSLAAMISKASGCIIKTYELVEIIKNPHLITGRINITSL